MDFLCTLFCAFCANNAFLIWLLVEIQQISVCIEHMTHSEHNVWWWTLSDECRQCTSCLRVSTEECACKFNSTLPRGALDWWRSLWAGGGECNFLPASASSAEITAERKLGSLRGGEHTYTNSQTHTHTLARQKVSQHQASKQSGTYALRWKNEAQHVYRQK